MTDEADDNAGTEEGGSLEAEGSETTPTTPVTQPLDELALARRRQAGADSARKQAEKDRDAALAELATLKGSGQVKDETDAAVLKEQLRVAQETIANAAADKTAAILDIRFPTARGKFPEITDEVRLAELEGFFGEPVEQGAPTPRQHNANKNANQPAPREKTANDVEAELLAMEMPTN